MKHKANTPLHRLALVSSALCLTAGLASADVVHLDDVIVDGSLCVGFDCVNGESFGFDTLRLKENNLRIHFDDTSTSASFPSNDWRIRANDTANGGRNYLAFEDATGGRTPFRVDAGAPNDSLRVDTQGDVGIGTSNPITELHVVDGDSPTLRLEQNGSSGFTPQTFDVVSNEANFFIRDVTNGSQLPFRIKPGADTDSLFIAANNDVGVGTDSPQGSLHVRGTDDSVQLIVEDTHATVGVSELMHLKNVGNPAILMTNTSTSDAWRLRAGGRLLFSHSTDHNSFLFDMNSAGQLTIAGQIITGGGTCGGGCDRVFDADYDMPSITEHADAMWSNGYLPNVGPTIENEPINVSDKLGRMLNELEKAHIYIATLNERLAVLEGTAAE